MSAVTLFYGATVAFLGGVALLSVLPLSWPYLALGLLIACGLFAVVWRFGTGTYLLLVAVVLGGSMVGALRMYHVWSQVGISSLVTQVGERFEIEGVVVREPSQRERSLHLYVRTVAGDTVLVTTDRYTKVAYGDKVVVEGVLKKPEAFTTDLGRTFDYEGYLRARGVEYQVSFAAVLVLGGGHGNSLVARLLTFKARFMTALATVLPEPAYGLGVGLLLGVSESLGEELEEAFRSTGIIHIVVLSGYNVMLVVAFVLGLLSYVFRPRGRLVGGLIAICAFALMVGLSATVVRASIMAALYLVAQTFGRGYVVLRGLMVAAVIMVLINPFLLVYDVGFQLSFLATLGLILVAPQLETLAGVSRIATAPRALLIATVSTQIAVLPLLLYQIGELSLVAVVVNLLVLPMVPVAMLLTFIAGTVAMVSPVLATVVVYPTYLSLTYITTMAQWWAGLPFASVAVPVFSFWWVVVGYAFLGMGWYWWTSRDRSTPTVSDISLEGWTIVEESAVRR